MMYLWLANKATHTYIFSQNFPEKRVEFPGRRFSSNKPFATSLFLKTANKQIAFTSILQLTNS